MLRSQLILAATAFIALVIAAPATAHSVLIATEPRQGAALDMAPEQVLLRFNEPVETALGSIRVFDASGERVDLEQILRPSGPEVAVELEDDLPEGTYVVAWRVISADSDPINGAWVFHVGEPGAEAEALLEGIEATPLHTDVIFTGGRFFEFVFLLFAVGGIAALAYPLRTAGDRVVSRLAGALALSAALFAVFALLGIAFHGAAAAGTGILEGFRWDVITAVAGTRYGAMALTQAGIGIGLVGIGLLLRRGAGAARPALLGLGAALGLGAVVTFPFAGHASTAGWMAILADSAHVAAAAAWVGGLAFLVAGLLWAVEDRWPLATRSVPPFSTMAVGSVVVLLAAGTGHSVLQVGTWSALWETTYGLLLLGKIGLILPLLALGAYNNRYAVPRLRDGVAEPREQRRFLHAAGAELVIMASIVGLTAVLVNTAQPKMEFHDGEEMAAVMVDFGEFEAEVTVDPGTAGRNQIMIMLGEYADGEMVEAQEVAVSAFLPAEEIGPLEFEAEPDPEEPGRYMVEEADLTIAGEWDLTVQVRVDEFELLTETVSVMIEEGRN